MSKANSNSGADAQDESTFKRPENGQQGKTKKLHYDKKYPGIWRARYGPRGK